MDQSTEQKVTYFVVFKRQKGEIEPAYSYMDKAALEQATIQGIIDKAYIVTIKDFYSKDETIGYLDRYKNEVANK